MLKSLELENFKAFGERVKIPFAPITLIFGENSSGKSSILQSLNLLKQTRESREAGALLLPRTEQGISDLGSFQDLLFDHDLSRAFTIKIALDLNKFDTFQARNIRRIFFGYDLFSDINVDSIAMEFKFCRPSLEKEVLLDELRIFLGENNGCLMSFKAITDVVDAPSSIVDEFPFFYQLHEQGISSSLMKCTHITEDAQIWKSRFYFCKKYKIEILEFLQKLLLKQKDYINNKKSNPEKFSSRKGIYFHEVAPTVRAGSNMLREHDDMEEEKIFDKEQKLSTSIEKAISFYSSNFDIKDFISRIKEVYIDQCIDINGFLPVSPFEDKSLGSIEELYMTSLNGLEGNQKNILTLDFRRLAILSGSVIDDVLSKLFPLGPFRKPPERWYIFTGTSPIDVGYKGDLLPSLLFRKPELMEKTNEWLKKLDIGYHLKINSLGEKLKDIFEVKLVDVRRNTPIEVGLSDVGFGLSQILPFIVQSLVSKGKIISIEQPEVHIHPRLQADLGNLLAETIKSPWHNQFIIETHSEHLVLRLQKLVSEKKLSPNDVSIIYVSRGANGSKVQQLQLDEEGDFIDDWPGGFFPERLRELR